MMKHQKSPFCRRAAHLLTLFLASLWVAGCGRSPEGQGPDVDPAAASHVLAAKVAPLALCPVELQDDWISLFDGLTLFGWQPNTDANWHVERGAITVSEGQKSLLLTTSRFDDFVLRLQFRGEPDANSGVFLRVGDDPEDVAHSCYELNIAGPDNPFPTGSLVYRKRAENVPEGSDWRNYEVTVQAGRVTAVLDGKQVLQYTDPNPPGRGFLGLQYNQGKLEFRGVKLKPLGLTSIFNGKDLRGWKTYPEMPSVFTVTEAGELNVKNGRGQLETEATYADFILQLECITHVPGTNSGIFFRCIPGQIMNGYESQIQNGYLDHDRAKPEDCGTGGIFRRVNARWIAADDQQWFYNTILADGPHIAVWVNGCQVTDWIDQRPPDPNPRKGLRLEAGTIMIQGHDATTDLSLRELRIKRL